MASNALILSKKVPGNGMSSSEEEELFQRNLKKSKNTESCPPGNEWPKLGEGVKKPWESGPSFAEKLQGLNRHEKVDDPCTNENMLSDDPLSESDHVESDQDDNEPLCVIIEGNKRKMEELVSSAKGSQGDVSMIPEIAGDSNVDVWKVVSKPRRQRRGGKDKISTDSQRSNGGSRFEVLRKDGDDVGSNKVKPQFAVLPGGTFKASRASEVGVVEKKGKGLKKNGKGKSKNGSSSVGNSGRSEKMTREEMQQTSSGNKYLSFASEKLNVEIGKDNDKMETQSDNLLLVGPEGAGGVESANVRKEVGDSFHVEPGEGTSIKKLEGKFWSSHGALDPDDTWEEEAQFNCELAESPMGPMCVEDGLAHSHMEGDYMVPDSQASLAD
ncbi:hypothetical protein K1719_043417 [Acacia pycnantha]|nr:hypothetical protein K1719_043417 [Acacia pycnantha]